MIYINYSLFLLDRNGRLNYPLLYFHRVLRLTPLLAVCVVVSMTIFRYFGTGPLWPFYNSMAVEENCRKNWWATLLYIQNYYDADNIVRYSINYYIFTSIFS